MNLLWRQEIPAEHKRSLEDLLIENRLREEYIERNVRTVMEDRHASRMAELASSSNRIAEQANLTAAALKQWTVVLAVATLVLAVATIALVWAMLSA